AHVAGCFEPSHRVFRRQPGSGSPIQAASDRESARKRWRSTPPLKLHVCVMIWGPFEPRGKMGGHVGTAPSTNQEAPLIDWEQLESTRGLTVLRVSVPGGWLVYASNSYHHHGGMTF